MVTKRPAHKWLAPDIELDLRNQIEKAKNETYEEWVEGSFELYKQLDDTWWSPYTKNRWLTDKQRHMYIHM